MRSVVGVDLSLTGPGIASIMNPVYGDDNGGLFVAATTLGRVPVGEVNRGLVLKHSAERVSRLIDSIVDGSPSVLVVMEAILLQSATGKAPERAAFWWMVRAELEERGYLVTSLHPTTRKSLALDDEGRAALKAMTAPERKKRAKAVGLASMRRRWPGVVFPDDNAADALVCADLGARALRWGLLPELENKNLPNAIAALGINERKSQ